MTTTTQCDRCSKDVGHAGEEYNRLDLAVGNRGCVKFCVDLCVPCSQSFEEWLGLQKGWTNLRQQGAGCD